MTIEKINHGVPIKLLVIDDDNVDRMHLRRTLKACGLSHELTEYEDAKDLPRTEVLNTFDCIFLDYLLPGDNGLPFLKRMRDQGVKVPIVIITSQGNETIAVELMKAGASDYIVKNEIDSNSIFQVLLNIMKMNNIMKEREKAEHALRISESRLAEAQRIAKFGNWEFDISQQDVYCSAEIFNILELHDKKSSITIKDVFYVIYPEDRNLIDSSWRNALQGKSFNFDFRVATKSGVKFVNTQGYTQRGSRGYPEKIIGTLQDITDRKNSEQEVSRARELAENSMKVRQIFLANMSHEIRTPMNAILGFTRLLYETNPTQEQKGFIDAIHFSGENLLVIINDILDLSKMQSGKMTIEKCEFNLHELTAGIITVLSPKAREKGLKLTSKIEQQIPCLIKGDPVRLNQVLTNLISNAIKFTEHGMVSLEISSNASQNETIILEFRVTDTGIGIPIDKQAAIFEDFVQASADTTRKYGGTGLGLAITKNLVELQEGKIFVESPPGSGSSFIVRLPFEKGSIQGAPVLPVQEQQGHSLERLRDSSILVVEDNTVNQLLVKKVLEKTGCRIEIASNGLEAISRVKTGKFDVILMDIQMPEMDGYETTQFIRTKMPAPFCDLPIIAMTAHAFGSDVMRCISEGMNDYISKPFKAEDLYQKIIKHLDANERPKIVKLSQSAEMPQRSPDLSEINAISQEDPRVLNELIQVYGKEMPGIVEKLRGYTKSRNFPAMRSVCRQIKTASAPLKMSALENAVEQLTTLLNDANPADHLKISAMSESIISLILAVHEELKRNLKKAC